MQLYWEIYLELGIVAKAIMNEEKVRKVIIKII